MRSFSAPINGKISLLTGSAHIFSHLIDDLHRARRTIDMEFYIFEGDRLGRVIIDILCRKARAGLDVRLLVDGFGSRGLKMSLRRQMRNSGIELHTYNKVSHRRLHRKIVVIDSCIAYVGGANIADRYVVGNSLGVWCDAQLRITGQQHAPLAELLDCDMRGIAANAYLAKQSNDGIELYYSSRDCKQHSIHTAYEDAIRKAQRSLTLSTPYFIPPAIVMQRLCECAERGVRVRIFIPERCGIPVVDDIMRHRAMDAASRGIEVMLCRDIFPHAKLLVADDSYTLVGSANLDSRSMNYNLEVMVGLHNHTVARSARHLFRYLERKSAAPLQNTAHSSLSQPISRLLAHLL